MSIDGLIIQMSILEELQQFRGSPKLIVNEKYMDDNAAKELARFIHDHGKIEYLELKSNDISGIGFAEIFKALQKNPNIRQINIEHNRLGEEGTEQWPITFGQLISKSIKIERLNFSNNRLGARSFSEMKTQLSQSKSLKLLELRYNQIPASEISSFIDELRNFKNDTLLYVELAGNKTDRDTLNRLEEFLKRNREKNPISKDNLMMTGGAGARTMDQRGFQSQSNFSRNNAIDDLSKENVLKHLEDLLDQARRGTIDLKSRLEEELTELQKRDKLDENEILDLDRKCNELTVSNRNINYELERTLQEHKQIEMDYEYQTRMKEERMQEANRELSEMQLKYEEIQNKMNLEHEAKLKEMTRVWEQRLRTVDQKIRSVETQSNSVDLQIQKVAQKRDKLRRDYEQEQYLLRQRIEQEQSLKYKLKLQALQAKVSEVEASREAFYKRGDDINYELETTHSEALEEIQKLESNIQGLKEKEAQLIQTNRDYMARNEMIKQDITVKEVTIEKLEQEINRINEEIEHRKAQNRLEIDTVMQDHEGDRLKRASDKKGEIQKLSELESTLRNLHLESAKLEQEYKVLEQRLQISISKGIQQVFADNSLY